MGRGYDVKEGVNRGNGTDPLNSWKGEVSSNTMGKKRRRRERERYGDEQRVNLLLVSKTFAALHK